MCSIAKAYNRNVEFIPMPDINESEKLNLKKVKEKWIFDSYCRMFLDHLLLENVEHPVIVHLTTSFMIIK